LERFRLDGSRLRLGCACDRRVDPARHLALEAARDAEVLALVPDVKEVGGNELGAFKGT
jgi:hypothetical protein